MQVDKASNRPQASPPPAPAPTGTAPTAGVGCRERAMFRPSPVSDVAVVGTTSGPRRDRRRSAEGTGVSAMECALQSRGAVSRGEHMCLPFRDFDERRHLLPFSLASGLNRGERLLYLSHATTEDALCGWLHEAGADAHRFQARGQVRLVPAAEVFLAEGAFSSANALRALTRYKREALWDGC